VVQDPIAQFTVWLEEAKRHPEIREPTAMTVATATAEGKPSARILLLKQVDAKGFVFFTNYHARKSEELAANPEAALCFYWMPLERQVRVEGHVEKISAPESDAYFATRERGKQLAAWASLQSQALENRAMLDARFQEMEQRYANASVPRPPHWGGWRLVPRHMEFWHQGTARLHDRTLYNRLADGSWATHFLYP
jgi:pyridoxamine 5'-phosphate oxidase